MAGSNLIRLSSSGTIKQTTIRPSSSKSESNRALIINALSGGLGTIDNLSDARDTQTMSRLLKSTEEQLDVLDAGTTMRFLTAYLAVITTTGKILTGSARMQERPIKILVEALNQLGADIDYEVNKGYPPLKIKPFRNQLTNKLSVPSNISSQYISALLMVGPYLPLGLELELVGEIYSEPYIRMTLALMEKFGVGHEWNGNVIKIPSEKYSTGEYTIESDWSGAGYWYGFIALSNSGEITLDGLRRDSYQGDHVAQDIMKDLSVETTFGDDQAIIKKAGTSRNTTLNFKDCPDFSMTVLVAAAAQKLNLQLTGLESLRIKETDRIAALQDQLKKVSVDLVEHDEHHWELIADQFHLEPDTIFETYDDHRMAMAFAPLAMIAPIRIEDPDVVQKSYPGFWDDVRKVGVEIQ